MAIKGVDVEKDGVRVGLAATLNFTGKVTATPSKIANRIDIGFDGGFTITGEMQDGGVGKTGCIALLADGRVLSPGGYTNDDQSAPTNRCQIYNPTTGEWIVAASMNAARFGHSKLRLPNGKMLVVGGVQTPSPFNTGAYSVEIYDPVANTWGSAFGSTIKTVAIPGGAPTAVPLGPVGALYTDATGFVACNVFKPSLPAMNAADLAAGMLFQQVAFPIVPLPGQYNVDVVTKTVTINSSSPVTVGIAFLSQVAAVGPNTPAPPNILRSLTNAVVLPNGKVLIIGGYHAQGGNSPALVECEIYDPLTGTWALTGSLNDNRYLGRLTEVAVLSSGRVMVAGGESREASDPLFNPAVDVLFSSEIYDVALGVWALGPPMNSPRSGQVQVPVPAGVFCAGGVTNTGGVLRSAEIYDEELNYWPQVPGLMTRARDSAAAVPLPGGGVFIQGGFGTHVSETGFHQNAEQYDPLSGLFISTQAPPVGLGSVNQAVARLATGDILLWGGTNNETTEKPTPVAALFTPSANH